MPTDAFDDITIPRPRRKGDPPLTLYKRFSRLLERTLPRGLFPRSLIIIITPMVVLQSIVAYVFMERHWEKVTKRLSTAVTQDIAMLIDVYKTYPQEPDFGELIRMARHRLNLSLSITPGGKLPDVESRPFFSLLDRTLRERIRRAIDRPFWIDTVGQTNYVDIRIKVDDAVFRIITRRKNTYASNSFIFILWMVASSLVLLSVAVVFLRNQIRPIEELARAAQNFGTGRDDPDFHPRGALEVQRAATAFIHMRDRIKRHVDQRTTMLAGVSHDLRTMLTRFKLQLAMLEDSAAARELEADVDEMQHMVEDYMAFVRGDGGETSAVTDIKRMLKEVRDDTRHSPSTVRIHANGDLEAAVKPRATKRCIANLVANACQHGSNVRVTAERTDSALRVVVEDNGPGIAEENHEDVFRPFVRLDNARGRETGGTGLGLSIARDIARGHGGDITLAKSPMGGLQATLQIPV